MIAGGLIDKLVLILGRNILSSTNVLCRKYTTNREKQSLKLIENLHKDGIKLGQPIFYSHPHLLKENELAIGVTVGEFKERRQRLMEAIQKQCNKLIRPKKFMVSFVFLNCK